MTEKEIQQHRSLVKGLLYKYLMDKYKTCEKFAEEVGIAPKTIINFLYYDTKIRLVTINKIKDHIDARYSLFPKALSYEDFIKGQENDRTRDTGL
jgi:hypothetical protein